MDLRTAAADDIEALFQLHCTVFRSHIETIWGWNDDWQLSNFNREFEAAVTEVILDEGIIVGFVQTIENSCRLYLHSIALSSVAQGQGIGTRLVKRLQQKAKGLGLPLELSVFRTNPRAMEFYHRLGFRKTGETDSHTKMSWAAIE